jgi:general secretion pathway protein C
MGFDRQLKRFYPLVLCGLIALAAYFQSSGIGQLVVSTIVAGTDATPPPVLIGTGVAKGKTRTGDPVLTRNPFDSVTGPIIGGSTPEIPDGVPPDPDAPTSDEDPACGFGRVVLISANSDPEWSFAAIDDGTGGSKLRRLGENVGSHTIQAFGWDRVWLAEGSKVCQLKLGEGKAAAKKTAARKPAKKSRRGGKKLSADMASKINKISDTEFTVERSVVDQILENQAELMRSARILPEKEGDKVVGIRLFGIRNGTLLNHLGMKNGDRLESINGFNMSDPQKALEAYGRLRTAQSLKVKVNRKGKPMTLEFKIQ